MLGLGVVIQESNDMVAGKVNAETNEPADAAFSRPMPPY